MNDLDRHRAPCRFGSSCATSWSVRRSTCPQAPRPGPSNRFPHASSSDLRALPYRVLDPMSIPRRSPVDAARTARASRLEPCPACGRGVDPIRAPRVLWLEDGVRFLCAEACRERFLAGERRFDAPARAPTPTASAPRPSIPDLVREATRGPRAKRSGRRRRRLRPRVRPASRHGTRASGPHHHRGEPEPRAWLAWGVPHRALRRRQRPDSARHDPRDPLTPPRRAGRIGARRVGGRARERSRAWSDGRYSAHRRRQSSCLLGTGSTGRRGRLSAHSGENCARPCLAEPEYHRPATLAYEEVATSELRQGDQVVLLEGELRAGGWHRGRGRGSRPALPRSHALETLLRGRLHSRGHSTARGCRHDPSTPHRARPGIVWRSSFGAACSGTRGILRGFGLRSRAGAGC